MPTPVRNPAWAAEFAEFIKDAKDVPYSELQPYWDAGPFKLRLRQSAVQLAANGDALVDTDVFLGKTWEAMELFDTITVRMPVSIAPVTLLVRNNLAPSLVHILFGRMPPEPPQQQPAPQEIDTMEKVRQAIDDGLSHEHLNGGGEYVPERPAAKLDLVERREPDGLPIFADVYALGDGADTLVRALLDEVRAFAREAVTPEQLVALGAKNPDIIDFVKDFGTEGDRKELQDIIVAAREHLTIPAATQEEPRRRARGPRPN